MTGLQVVAVGASATVQDRGRPGWAHSGLGVGGALDRGALRLANRVLGNGADAAGVEVLLGGLTVRAEGDVAVMVTGAPAGLRRGRRPVAFAEPVLLRHGDELSLSQPLTGMRSYLAVRGGFDVAVSFGSRSSDPVNGIGPGPLVPGDVLPVGRNCAGPIAFCFAVAAAGPVTVRTTLGPRDDWFTPDALHILATSEWLVTGDLDRVGVRLDGPSLARSRSDELPSEAVIAGAVQVPADGKPLVFLADHPVTGGYPVVAVVDDADLDRFAQLRPGDAVRFAVRRRGPL